MKEEYGIAIAETLDILKHTEKESVNKISKSFIEFLKENAADDYKVDIDYSKPLSEVKLNKNTLTIIAMISYSYWCNEEEKKEMLQKLKENDIILEKEIREKYHTDNLFERNKKEEKAKEKEIESLAEIKKEGFLIKIINKIKKFFKK